MRNSSARSDLTFISSPTEFFSGLVSEGMQKRNLTPLPAVANYLVGLLEYYLNTDKLFEPETTQSGDRNPTTMAEMYLLAQNADSAEKITLLKKLADKSLYISGFFSESFQRKLFDVDYYAQIGGSAYACLADSVPVQTEAHVYRVFSRQFLQFVEVLESISTASGLRSNESVLRLYDRYVRTGSNQAKEKLQELGIFALPPDQIRKARQD